MASNRYTNLAWSSLRDLPHLTLPYQELDSILQSQQNKIDITKASTDLVPDYIKDSSSDRQLAGQIMQYQQGVKQQLADIAKTGNVPAYMQALNQVQEQVKRLYQPGGAADILKQRKLQDEGEKKRLYEFYKDKPDWADYAIKNRKYNDVGYNSQTGEFNNINTFGNTPVHVQPKEIDEWANRNLDNIKDSLLEDAEISKKVTRKQLDAITSVYDFWQLKGVPYEKIAFALANTIPKEYVQSLYHQAQVDRFYNPNMPELDPNIFVKGDDGKDKLNINNPVGRLLHGYALEGERKNLEHNRIKDDNEVKLLKIKDQIENPYIPPTSGYTEAVKNPLLIGLSEIKVIDGKPQPKTKLEEHIPQSQIIYGEDKYGVYKKTYTKDNISEQENDLIEGIKERYKTKYSKDISDKQLEQAYNTLIEDRKSSAITFEQITDPKQLKNLNDRVLGSEKKIVNIGVRPVYFLDSSGNVTRPMNAQDAIDRLGVENLDKGIEGKISADNSLGLPSGDYATAIDKNGKFVTMIIGNRSIEEDAHFAPVNKLSKPKYTLKPETLKIGNDTYVSEPVVDVGEDGQYQGIDVKVTKYDAFGKEVGQWSLPEIEQSFKQTNPYK